MIEQMQLVNISEVHKSRVIPPPAFWWKIPWPWDDVVYFDCGHAGRFSTRQLEDVNFEPKCPYKEWGACNENNN